MQIELAAMQLDTSLKITPPGTSVPVVVIIAVPLLITISVAETPSARPRFKEDWPLKQRFGLVVLSALRMLAINRGEPDTGLSRINTVSPATATFSANADCIPEVSKDTAHNVDNANLFMIFSNNKMEFNIIQ